MSLIAGVVDRGTMEAIDDTKKPNNDYHIVFTTDSREFFDEKVYDRYWSDGFPGIGWLFHLKKSITDVKGLDLLTVRETAENPHITYRHIAIIGEPLSRNAKRLIAKGAVPLLAINAESPLYAYRFYDTYRQINSQYKYVLTFKGLDAKNTLYFPSFHREWLGREIVKWDDRKYMAIVAGNKSGYTEWMSKMEKLFDRLFSKKPKTLDIILRDTALPNSISLSDRLSYVVAQLKYELGKYTSSAFHAAMKNELHSMRWNIIKYFGRLKKLDLYGSGWDEYERYPKKLRNDMKKIVPEIYKGKCIDKVETIADYKFVFCAENTSYPGYVTEKIIDCFVAGAIPIYIGAPDVLDFIPSDTFIDYRKFNSIEDLHQVLEKMSEEESMMMVQKGRQFLASSEGDRFSYEAMSEKVFKIIREYYDRAE